MGIEVSPFSSTATLKFAIVAHGLIYLGEHRGKTSQTHPELAGRVLINRVIAMFHIFFFFCIVIYEIFIYIYIFIA